MIVESIQRLISIVRANAPVSIGEDDAKVYVYPSGSRKIVSKYESIYFDGDGEECVLSIDNSRFTTHTIEDIIDSLMDSYSRANNVIAEELMTFKDIIKSSVNSIADIVKLDMNSLGRCLYTHIPGVTIIVGEKRKFLEKTYPILIFTTGEKIKVTNVWEPKRGSGIKVEGSISLLEDTLDKLRESI